MTFKKCHQQASWTAASSDRCLLGKGEERRRYKYTKKTTEMKRYSPLWMGGPTAGEGELRTARDERVAGITLESIHVFQIKWPTPHFTHCYSLYRVILMSTDKGVAIVPGTETPMMITQGNPSKGRRSSFSTTLVFDQSFWSLSLISHLFVAPEITHSCMSYPSWSAHTNYE